MTLDKAMSQVPDLRKLYEDNPVIQNVINIAKRLEGLVSQRGRACGRCHHRGSTSR